MTFTAAGVLATNAASGLTTLAHTNNTAANVLVVSTKVTSLTITVSSITGGGATSWVRICAPQQDGTRNLEMWMGRVTTTGAQTITVTFSASVTGLAVDLDAQEFSSSLGAGAVWAKDVDGFRNNTSSTTITFPTLAPTVTTPELYVGMMRIAGGTGFTGITGGFTSQNGVNGNPFVYGLAVAGSVSPSETNSTNATSLTLAALITDTTAAGIPNVTLAPMTGA